MWIVLMAAIIEGIGLAATVAVSPSSAQLKLGGQLQFTATGSADGVVLWSITGSGCSGISCGMITSGGLYTAPSTAPNPSVVKVIATSLADLTQSGSASVTIGAPVIGVTISPMAATIAQSGQQQFSATVSGSANMAVNWIVSGVGCSGSSCGTVSSTGLYTAPAVIPTPAQVTVTATSVAAPTVWASATVGITPASSVSVSVSPSPVQVGMGSTQLFSSTVTGSTNTSVTWTVAGTGCSGSACGTISSAGLYTAPAVIPTPALVTVTATSVAAPTQSGTASATIVVPPVSVMVAPSMAQVPTGGQQQFTSTVTGTANTAVTWSVTGSGCSGAACGTISTSGVYTAPSTVPNPAQVSVTATSVAAPTKSASAAVTINSGLVVTPSLPTLAPGAKQQFTASGPGSGVVIWSASGSGCSGITCGSINSTGLYTAPATAPNPAIVKITATSLSNATITGSTWVTIDTPGLVAVMVSPANAQVGVGAQQQFTAAVTGTSNTAVVWSVSGLTCAGADCGTITSGGLYTAPLIVPNPSSVTVKATSVADSTKTSSAMVTITQQIAVSISPNPAQVAVGAVQKFTAQVTGTTITGVTWSVAGAGCGGAACGTVSSAGLYTAPGAVPTPAQVTVTATANADGKTAASAIVTIFAPITISISPPSALVTIGEQQQFQAFVSGSASTAVTWSLSGAGCSGSSCGTISTAGLYTPPATVPTVATVTVTATSQANTALSASAVVTIAATNNAKLNGQYAFWFTGFDSNGVNQVAGSITTDGNGNIVSGLEDVNDTAGPSTSLAISGTYQVDGDNRGVMTINSPLGSQTFAFALNKLGTKGRLISFDQSGVRGSGVLERQDPTAFDASVLMGGYVLNLTGWDFFAGTRIGALGLIFLDGSGFISGASMDVNDGGNVSPTYATFSGSYSVDDSTGRGTATLNIPGFDGGTFDFAFYIVSANEILLESVDALSYFTPNVFGGPAELQTGTPFLTGSFSGGSVFTFNGTNASGTAPVDSVGRIQFNDDTSVIVNFDQNSGGKVTVADELTGAYVIELNGRGTLNLDNSKGSTTVWNMYAISPNQAFLMDSSTSAVSMGEMKPQTSVPPFSNSSIVGTYLLGSDEPIVQTTPLYSGIAAFDGGTNTKGLGTVTGTEDISLAATLSPKQALTGTYSVSGVSNNGRGAVLLTLPSGETIAVWVISASEFVGLDIDSTTGQPVILHFEQ
jgi:hypothetical protein